MNEDTAFKLILKKKIKKEEFEKIWENIEKYVVKISFEPILVLVQKENSKSLKKILSNNKYFHIMSLECYDISKIKWEEKKEEIILKMPKIIPFKDIKKYFRLFVSNKKLNLTYKIHNQEKVSEAITNGENALAWIGESNGNMHYFLFKLKEKVFVLSSNHYSFRGMSNYYLKEIMGNKKEKILKSIKENTLNDIIKNANRWNNEEEVDKISGNYGETVHEYVNEIDDIRIKLDIGYYIEEEIDQFTDVNIGFI